MQSADQELSRDLRLIQLFGSPHLGLCESLTELDRRQKGGHLGRAQPGAGRQLAEIEASHPGQSADVGEQAVGFNDRAAPPPAGAEQHGQQLGIRERTGTELEQTLARPLRRLHLANALSHLNLHGVFPMRGRDLNRA
jgi:hypothetical protein